MDASPTGAGLCAATLPRDAVKELWRYSEQKGFYTKLLEPAGAILAAAGLDEDPGVGLVEDLGDTNVAGLSFGSEPLPLKRPLSTTGGFLHLFLPGSTWDQAHEAAGLAAVPLDDPRLPSELHFTSLSSDAVFHGLRDLITSGAVFDLHVSAPALSFLPRGRFKARSEADPSAACRVTGDLALHNQLARRLCFLMCLAASCGVYFSVAQPAASLMFRLHCFRSLIACGAVLSYACACDFGAPFRRPLAFLHNKPWLLELGEWGGVCRCPPGASHFPVAGSFSHVSAGRFETLCSPSATAVFGRSPRAGELVSSYSAEYPRALAYRAASGSALATAGMVAPMPASAPLRTLKALGFWVVGPEPSFLDTVVFEPRSFHDDPEWIGELADCLEFVELLRYKVRGTGPYQRS